MILSVLLLTLLPPVLALKCYVCDSAEDEGCEPLDLRLVIPILCRNKHENQTEGFGSCKIPKSIGQDTKDDWDAQNYDS